MEAKTSCDPLGLTGGLFARAQPRGYGSGRQFVDGMNPAVLRVRLVLVRAAR